MATEFAVILEGRSFLEAPRWHRGRLWASDFHTLEVLSCRADGSDVRVEARVPGRPSGLGWLADGRLLVVSMDDHKVLRREDNGALVTHADLSPYCTGPCNDMVVDSLGRAFVGNFGFDLDAAASVVTANLMQVDPDGTVSIAATHLRFPNGGVVLGRTLILAETTGQRLSAFEIDAHGGLGPRRDWARFGEVPTSTDLQTVISQLKVAPDGICADAEGAIWVADALGNRVLRVREGGEVLQTISVGTGVYACVLGGDDDHTLFLCTAPSFATHERRTTREARMLATTVSVPGPKSV
jgi:sugar lactone lactonase YvrE